MQYTDAHITTLWEKAIIIIISFGVSQKQTAPAAVCVRASGSGKRRANRADQTTTNEEARENDALEKGNWLLFLS